MEGGGGGRGRGYRRWLGGWGVGGGVAAGNLISYADADGNSRAIRKTQSRKTSFFLQQDVSPLVNLSKLYKYPGWAKIESVGRGG